MVVAEDFEFKLVSAAAEDNDHNGVRRSFQEHTGTNGKTYVEVEPDTEYFLSIQKIRSSSSSAQVLSFIVDGKDLGFSTTMLPHHVHNPPLLYGIESELNGVQTSKALKFVKAAFTTTPSTRTDDGSNTNSTVASSRAGMGKIEMVVCEGIDAGMVDRLDFNAASSFTASSIQMDATTPTSNADITKKKNLRSGVGCSTVSRAKAESKQYRAYAKGAVMYTITLYYCAAPGLIAVGILPKPPFWTQVRKDHPAQTSATEKQKIENGIISIKSNNNGEHVLELNDDSSDTEDEDNGDEDEIKDHIIHGTTTTVSACHGKKNLENMGDRKKNKYVGDADNENNNNNNDNNHNHNNTDRTLQKSKKTKSNPIDI